VPYQAYVKAASYPNHGLICEQNVDEMKRVFNKKFPMRLAALDRFLSTALLTLELVPVPVDEDVSESQIRDVKDRPILRAALMAKADILVTGDKDFLESGLEHPEIMAPAEFLERG
jgi:putative PIN family toxin of toxin-antitoxin system